MRILFPKLLTVAATTSAGGGIVGALLLSRQVSRFLVLVLSKGDQTMFLDVRPDWRVFCFAALLGLLTCLLFALGPALQATRARPADALKACNRLQ